MWRVCIWILCVFCAYTVLAGNHYISHVAGSNWTTTITAYNDGPVDRTFTLYRYDADGMVTTMPDLLVPAQSALVLTSADFGYDGSAMVETPETESPLSIKLAYRYRESHSLCEFFIPDGAQATNWMLPNPFQSHFDWFGMAIANHGDTAATLTLTAWKNGAVVDTHVFDLSAKHKVVDVADGFWSGMDYADVDLVTMESTLPLAAPISITGNTEQDRHVFFLGQEEVVTEPPSMHIYNIPHIAASNWTTRLTIFNNTGDAAAISLSTWTPEGDPDLADAIYAVPANGTLELSAGTDFVYGGIGTIYSEDDIQVKLTYRYQVSESLCEFFLSEAESTQWFIPNSIHDWFDWFGMAISNPTTEPVVVALDAYKDGVLMEIGTRLLDPNTKIVGLAADLWPVMNKAKGAAYDDVDMVVIRSNAKIPTPLSITGNEAQDRHVFFLSSKDVVDPDFPDPSFKAYILENFDTNEDGTIDAAEADAVTVINTPGSWNNRGDIRDITGVEIFTNLFGLDVQGEQLSWIPDLSGFTNLHYLDARSNNLVMVPDWTTLTELRRIDCTHNNLTEIPPVAPLVNLDYLLLGNNQLSSIPDLTALTQLTRLEVYENNLSELTGTANLTNMEVFNISDNNFNALPDISTMSHLRDLHCDKHNISTLPDLSPYPDLFYLTMSDNNISTVTGLSGLTNMYLMDLSKNPISTLEDLSALDNLVQFDIGYTDIATVPGLGNLDSLTTFYCHYSLVTDLTALNGKTDFSRLSCNGCVGIFLPDFTGWTSLTRLYITFCQLDDVPDVTSCTSLQYFGAAYNNFGADDCPMIQAIEAMGTVSFTYNPQHDGSTLTCD